MNDVQKFQTRAKLDFSLILIVAWLAGQFIYPLPDAALLIVAVLCGYVLISGTRRMRSEREVSVLYWVFILLLATVIFATTLSTYVAGI